MSTTETGRVEGKPPRSRESEGGGFRRFDEPSFEGGDYEPGGERTRRYSQISERSRCRFCREKVTRVDFLLGSTVIGSDTSAPWSTIRSPRSTRRAG